MNPHAGYGWRGWNRFVRFTRNARDHSTRTGHCTHDRNLDRAIGKFRGAGNRSRWCRPWARFTPAHRAGTPCPAQADRVVVSIFVNPAQFAPHEDFSTYPRPFDADVDVLRDLEVDLVWAPQLDVMYPPQFATRIIVKGPAEADLEDRFRPHFFGGVATVVAKLFTQCRPDYAMFGEKDYQQLKTVTRMARDLDLRVEVVGVPTVREQDGLALSSRNTYLDAKERAVAPSLYRVLSACAARIAAGEPIARV
jgi:pantoate--beta-alanine ligase